MRWATAFALLAVGLMLAGCSEAESPGDENHRTSAAVGGARDLTAPAGSPLPEDAAVPEFTGPYATDFDRAFRDSTSELQRRILEDGAITEQEIRALQDEFRNCMAANGIADVTFQADGSFSFREPSPTDEEKTSSVVASCQESALGLVGIVSFAQQRNPAHADEGTIMAECLVRYGLEPPGYTAEDYRRDAETATFDFPEGDPDFLLCAADPFSEPH